MAYPVSVGVEPQFERRDRLTTAFRLVLAIPHLLLVGLIGSYGFSLDAPRATATAFNNGLIGIVVSVLAVVSWLTILLSDRHVEGIREFTRFYLRWRLRVMAYLLLLVDAYPPFGDGPYPTSLEIAGPAGARDKLSVALRLIFVIPHFIVLFFVLFVCWVLTAAAWLAILITGRYPQAFAWFPIGVLRWVMRVEAYLFLMVDQYPPFSLS